MAKKKALSLVKESVDLTDLPEARPTPPVPPPVIELMPVELEGFRALRAEEIALGARLEACATAVLQSRGCPPNAQYVSERDPKSGSIVRFVLRKGEANT